MTRLDMSGSNPTAPDILITNGHIVTLDTALTVIPKGAVAIKGTQIQAIASQEEFLGIQAGETINANGGIVMPGLVNCHTHLPMTLFRGLADDLPLDRWLNEHMFPAEGKWINPETAFLGSQLACLEMLLSGTTTCCDGYFLEEAVARAVAGSGMRAVLGHGIIDHPAPGVPDPEENVRVASAFAQSHLGKYPLITPSLFCHTPYTCSARTLKAAKERARELGVLFQVHLAEARAERIDSEKEHGLSPVRYLDGLGVLDENTLCVHCVWVDDRDIKIFKDKNVALACCVESNLKLGSGVAPGPAFIKEGLAAGLGTDGCASNNDLDIFGEIRTMALVHKGLTLDPTLMSARDVLLMATKGGARALGLDREIGSLTCGRQADIIIIDTRKPHLTPLYNPVSHLVYTARGSDVRDVIIAGKPIIRDRNILTLDADAIIREVRSLAALIKRG